MMKIIQFDFLKLYTKKCYLLRTLLFLFYSVYIAVISNIVVMAQSHNMTNKEPFSLISPGINGAVSIVDGLTNQLIDVIETEVPPGFIGINQINNIIYVGTSSFISIIDGLSNNVINKVDVCPGGGSSVNIGVNLTNNIMYIGTECGVALIKVVDGLTPILSFINLEGTPLGIGVDSTFNRIYVSTDTNIDFIGDQINVVDGNNNKVVNTINVHGNIIKVNSETHQIYVADFFNNKITVIDSITFDPITTIDVDNGSIDIAINTITNQIYVVNKLSNTVNIIDGNSNLVIDTFEIKGSPSSIELNQITNIIYVVDNMNDIVNIIDGVTNIQTSFVAFAGFEDLKVNTVTNRIYVSHSPLSGLIVRPSSANKSLRMNVASVSVLSPNGNPLQGRKIKAFSNGRGTTVLPLTAVTDTDGTAKFKFKFGLAAKNGKITFTVENLNASITQTN